MKALPTSEEIDAEVKRLGWSRLFGIVEEHWPGRRYRVWLENKSQTRVFMLWQRNGSIREERAETWGECLTKMGQPTKQRQPK